MAELQTGRLCRGGSKSQLLLLVMKRSAFGMVLVVVATAGGWGGCTTTKPAEDAADAATKGTARVQVVFANPQRFTDARSSLGGGADPRNLDPLGEFLVREASEHLRPGERMAIVFNDVDLAGDFEVGSMSSAGDVRVVRDIYSPRLEFEYTIVDQTDTVVAQGTVKLANREFLREMRSPLDRGEPLTHEKKLLRDWVRKTLANRPEGGAAEGGGQKTED